METPGAETESAGGGLLFEASITAATLSRWTLLSERRFGDAAARARSLVFAPVAGFAAGVVLALADRGLATVAGPFSRSLIVLSLSELFFGGIDALGIADLVGAVRIGSRPASTGLARIGPLGAVAALGWFATAVGLLARIHDAEGRGAALVMATTLSRWAIVPIGYGLRPLERWGLGTPYEGGIGFREFAVSSVVALSLAMGLYENIGLAVIVALAVAILGLRLLLSRRLGGAAGYALAGSMAVCELVVFAVLVGLGV